MNNISQIEQRERELRSRADDIQARAKECERKGDPAWMSKSIDRDIKEWQVEWGQVTAERKKYESGQAFLNKMGGNAAGQKGFGSAETKATGLSNPPSALHVPVEAWKSRFSAAKSNLRGYTVELSQKDLSNVSVKSLLSESGPSVAQASVRLRRPPQRQLWRRMCTRGITALRLVSPLLAEQSRPASAPPGSQ